MSPVLIDGCAIATVDAAGTEIAEGWILTDGPRIAALGPGAPPGVPAATTRIDGRGCLATPGLVNCHHHLWQWSTRGLSTEENLFAWACVLGEDLAFSAAAPAYAAPTRAADLSGLPPAFIEVGSAELFRDEDVDYAMRIWATGGQAELHVWSGGCHGFDIYMPDAEITRAALAARTSWLRRLLAL